MSNNEKYMIEFLEIMNRRINEQVLEIEVRGRQTIDAFYARFGLLRSKKNER